MPGKAQSTKETCELASEPKVVELRENNFDFEAIWA
jgi:hypothetical protein